MSNKDSRSGGKYSGNHTTLIHAAAIVCDIAEKCTSVTRISPGFIKSGLKSVQGKRRVKITDKNGSLLLSVRDNTSHQEVFVYTNDLHVTKLSIAKGARDENISVSFSKK